MRNPRIFPVLIGNLAGMPPALIVTAEYDPLRDEGERYGQRLKEAGVSTTISRYDGMIHGFFSMEAVLTKSQAAVAESVRALQAAFNTK